MQDVINHKANTGFTLLGMALHHTCCRSSCHVYTFHTATIYSLTWLKCWWQWDSPELQCHMAREALLLSYCNDVSDWMGLDGPYMTTSKNFCLLLIVNDHQIKHCLVVIVSKYNKLVPLGVKSTASGQSCQCSSTKQEIHQRPTLILALLWLFSE